MTFFRPLHWALGGFLLVSAPRYLHFICLRFFKLLCLLGMSWAPLASFDFSSPPVNDSLGPRQREREKKKVTRHRTERNGSGLCSTPPHPPTTTNTTTTTLSPTSNMCGLNAGQRFFCCCFATQRFTPTRKKAGGDIISSDCVFVWGRQKGPGVITANAKGGVLWWWGVTRGGGGGWGDGPQ